MKIEFKNLGHIESGIFEPSKLTLLIGDNGSGKTTLLETVSYIQSLYFKQQSNFVKHFFQEFAEDIEISYKKQQLSGALEEHIKKDIFQDTSEGAFEIEPFVDLSIEMKFNDYEKVNDKINEYLSDFKPEVIRIVNDRIFNDELETFDFNFLDTPKLNSNSIVAKFRMFDIQERIIMGTGRASNIFSLDDLVPLDLKLLKEEHDFNLDYDNTMLEIVDLDLLYNEILNQFKMLYFEDLFRSYFSFREFTFLPSERSTFISDGIEKISESSNGFKSMRYSEEQFIRKYISLFNLFKQVKKGFKFSDSITELLEGTPEIGEDGSISAVSIGEKKIGKHMFSTKINRIIPYLILENPTFLNKHAIIEEPEAHMSLKSMDGLIKYFLKKNENMNLIITTHSDVFFNKLYNKVIKENISDFKVYELFSEGDKSVLKQIEREEYGYKISLFNDELDKLFDETIELQNGDKYD